MMNTNQTPAFPTTNINRAENYGSRGMALRDYFATAALQGLLADPNVNGKMTVIATTCYRIADAMLEARQA